MAFATASPTTINLGGGFRLQTGTWTGSVGDADGSVSLRGGRIYAAQFLINSGTMYDSIPVTTSTSSGVITVTVNNRQTVTDGTYFILYQ